MGVTIQSRQLLLSTQLQTLDQRVQQAERLPTGQGSIGIQFLRPAVKAGTPSDADFTTVPPIGSIVIDTSGSKLWVRMAAGVWKSTALA